MKYEIREMRKTEYGILENFLYEAIFVPEGVPAPPKDIIHAPDLQIYIADFGKKRGDICLAAEVGHKIIGAVWARMMEDYGHIDDATPSLAMSLYSEYRNQGIGTALMGKMSEELKKKGYRQASLSVQKANYAVKLYQNAGFEILRETEEEYIMVCKLCP